MDTKPIMVFSETSGTIYFFLYKYVDELDALLNAKIYRTCLNLIDDEMILHYVECEWYKLRHPLVLDVVKSVCQKQAVKKMQSWDNKDMWNKK